MKTLRASWQELAAGAIALTLLLLAGRVFGQDALEIIGGDAKTIKVEKQVITYVDATLVSKLPFTIKAPAGGFEYEWSLPKSVTGTTKRNVLEVNATVKGEATISVTWLVLSVEGGAIKQTERSATRTFYVGEVKPVPDPTPVPDTPLVKTFRTALAKDTPGDRNYVAALAEACKNAAAAANDASLTKLIQVNAAFVVELKAYVGQALPNVRAAVTAELDSRLPRTTDGLLDAESRSKINAAFTEIASALRAIQ